VRDLLRPASRAHLQLDRARHCLTGALAQEGDCFRRRQLVNDCLRQRPLRLALNVPRQLARHVRVNQRELLSQPGQRSGPTVQPAFTRVAQHRPNAGDAVALICVGDLAPQLTSPQMHYEVHDVLTPQQARILAPVAPHPKHLRELDRDLRVEPQQPHAVRHQPMPVPLLDQLPQPPLGDRGVVDRLATRVRAQHPKSPHVPLELSFRVGQQPLDRRAQPPVKHSHHLASH
jgi:hypothetical protein